MTEINNINGVPVDTAIAPLSAQCNRHVLNVLTNRLGHVIDAPVS